MPQSVNTRSEIACFENIQYFLKKKKKSVLDKMNAGIVFNQGVRKNVTQKPALNIFFAHLGSSGPIIALLGHKEAKKP